LLLTIYFNALPRYLSGAVDMSRPNYDSSRDRQELGRLVEEFARLTQDFTGTRNFPGRDLLLNGNLQKLSRRCGKPNCRCSQGKLHQSTIFIDRTGGERKVRTLTIRECELLRNPILAFQALRRKRARLSKLFQEALVICDRLCAFRASRGARQFQDILRGAP
jgi:hypothetical protein